MTENNRQPDGLHPWTCSCGNVSRTPTTGPGRYECLDCGDSLQVGNSSAVVASYHKKEVVNNPSHYGGADDPYETIKVIEAWQLGFNLGNTVKYLSRAGKKGAALIDLRKAAWYLDREIAKWTK